MRKEGIRIFTGPCCNLIGSRLKERSVILFIDTFQRDLLAGDLHSNVKMDRHFQDRQHLPTHLKPTLGICLLTLGLGRYSGFSYYLCFINMVYW